MNFLRKILFPIGIIYWIVTYMRNLFYDYGFFKSSTYSIPIITIGNLSVGGSGKTPHTEYLIRLLKNNYKIAVLSRGYKRSTKGFVLANETISSQELGDESFQINSKFKDISIAVCEDRRFGIDNLVSFVNPNIILLDDAFQHRKVKAGFYILLTAFDDLFSDDYILPLGNLREPSLGKKRANLVIVTKCPNNLSLVEQENIKRKLKVKCSVYFTSIDYDSEIFGLGSVLKVEEIKNREKVIVAGIAKPKYFVDYLNSGKDHTMIYSDHHNFSTAQITKLNEVAKEKIIVTTEKDYVRLNGKINPDKLFYLPIKIKFISDEDKFTKEILSFLKN